MVQRASTEPRWPVCFQFDLMQSINVYVTLAAGSAAFTSMDLNDKFILGDLSSKSADGEKSQYSVLCWYRTDLLQGVQIDLTE